MPGSAETFMIISLVMSLSSSSLLQEARESNAVHITKMFLQVFIVFISICSVVNVPTIINAVKQEILHHWALNVLNHRA